MKNDDYGQALERALRTADHPMSAAELRDAAGCSRQRVYVWLQANAPHLIEAGKNGQGAMMYRWDESQGKGGQSADDPTTMKVRSFFVDHGSVVLVLVGPDGSIYHARPAGAEG